jgi:hypothetical protein
MMELELPNDAVLVSNSEFIKLRKVVYDKWVEYPMHNGWRACFRMIHEAKCTVGPAGEKLWRLDSIADSPSNLLSFIDANT